MLIYNTQHKNDTIGGHKRFDEIGDYIVIFIVFTISL